MCACKATTTITTQLGPGDLVSIHSIEENTFVKKLATADIWLGIVNNMHTHDLIQIVFTIFLSFYLFIRGAGLAPRGRLDVE